jgi:two-component system, response regulator
MNSEKVILLVEDNPSDEELTLRALKKAHVLNQVVVARDGAEAIEYLRTRTTLDTPQLVLLDLKLPKVDGLDVLRVLRANEHTKLLPVVVLTSSVEDQDLVQSYSLGANSYVQKPVDFVQFTDAVRQLGLYWLVLNQSAPVPAKS